MTREELVDELRDALSDACDMDVTFGMYAEAAVRCLEKHGVFREWRDIATAPKDGTRVWAWFPWPEKAFAIKWETGGHQPNHWTMDDGGPAILTYDPPSHWQPLPSPPDLADS